MSKKRSRRKAKYNHNKATQRAVPSVLKTLGAVAVRLHSKVTDNPNEANTSVFNCRTAKRYPANHAVQRSLTDTRMKWAVYACAICKDDTGAPYHQGFWTLANEHYYFIDLQEHVADLVEEAYNEATASHLIDVAWIAVPWGKELTDKQVIEILINYGAFENAKELKNA